jgi:hypothetical protein
MKEEKNNTEHQRFDFDVLILNHCYQKVKKWRPNFTLIIIVNNMIN